MDNLGKDLLRQVQRTAAQDYINDAEFLERFEEARRFAIKQVEDSGELGMMFVCHLRLRDREDNSKETWVEVPMMFADWPPPDDQKYEVMQGLGVRLATQFPDYILVAVIQMAEAWLAQYHEEDVGNGPMMPAGAQMPSERADRMEVVIVDGCTIDQRKSNITIPMVRTSSGKFGTWGAPMEKLYDPNDDETVEQQNYLITEMFKGSTGAAYKRIQEEKGGKHED